MDRRGITLIELIVVTALLGVVTLVGVPTYRATIERAYCRHAQDLLLAVYTGERIHFNRTDQYLAVGPGGNWRPLNLDDPNSPASPVSFQVVTTGCAPPSRCFVASATHQGDVLPALTVDQDRNLASPSGRCPN